MVKRVSAYEACGQTFATKKEAEYHEASQRLNSMISTARFCEPGELENVRLWMLDKGWGLVNVLSDVLRRSVNETES